MKKHFLKIWILLLAASALYMAASAIVSHADEPAAPDAASAETTTDHCAPSDNDYNNEDKSLEDIMVEYHKNMNDTFNKNIKNMIRAESAAAKSGNPDPNGNPPKPVSADSPQILQPCPEENYSTYCVATRIISDGKKGYIGYVHALECRRNQLFDTKTEKVGYSDVMETILSGGLSNPAMVEAVAEQPLQTQKAMEVSARMDAIDREISAAKRALDQTLAAYNELRTAWPMHKKYMQIYESLIKYRDKMVDIRKQVEEFPSKFIDASTTKCT